MVKYQGNVYHESTSSTYYLDETSGLFSGATAEFVPGAIHEHSVGFGYSTSGSSPEPVYRSPDSDTVLHLAQTILPDGITGDFDNLQWEELGNGNLVAIWTLGRPDLPSFMTGDPPYPATPRDIYARVIDPVSETFVTDEVRLFENYLSWDLYSDISLHSFGDSDFYVNAKMLGDSAGSQESVEVSQRVETAFETKLDIEFSNNITLEELSGAIFVNDTIHDLGVFDLSNGDASHSAWGVVQ